MACAAAHCGYRKNAALPGRVGRPQRKLGLAKVGWRQALPAFEGAPKIRHVGVAQGEANFLHAQTIGLEVLHCQRAAHVVEQRAVRGAFVLQLAVQGARCHVKQARRELQRRKGVAGHYT